LAEPSLAIDHAYTIYKKQDRSEKWIDCHLCGQETRNKLTDYWAGHEIKPDKEFAINLSKHAVV
jgi:DNA-damage-inducible protein D